MLLQQLRPPIYRERACPPCQFGKLCSDMAHEPLQADAFADSLGDWREIQIGFQVWLGGHGMPPAFATASGATSALTAQAIRTPA